MLVVLCKFISRCFSYSALIYTNFFLLGIRPCCTFLLVGKASFLQLPQNGSQTVPGAGRPGMLPRWNIPVLTKCLLAGLKLLHLPWSISVKHLTCSLLKVHVHLQRTVCTVIKYSGSCGPWHCHFPVTVFKDAKSHLPGFWVAPSYILTSLIWTQKTSYLCTG